MKPINARILLKRGEGAPTSIENYVEQENLESFADGIEYYKKNENEEYELVQENEQFDANITYYIKEITTILLENELGFDNKNNKLYIGSPTGIAPIGINLDASPTMAGIVNTSAQEFGGKKTFKDGIVCDLWKDIGSSTNGVYFDSDGELKAIPYPQLSSYGTPKDNNANNATNFGIYHFNGSTTNAPTTSAFDCLVIGLNGGSRILQICMRDTSTTDPYIFKRLYYNGAWGKWYRYTGTEV